MERQIFSVYYCHLQFVSLPPISLATGLLRHTWTLTGHLLALDSHKSQQPNAGF
jgi:hypothetical protein